MAKTASIHTLGCRVNAYESEAMAEQLRRCGYAIVPFDERADVCVINTCTVTNIADRKSRQMLHRARELNPEALIIAAGCYAEDAGHALELDPAVDLVIGNRAKQDLAGIIARWEAGEDTGVRTDPISAVREYDGLSITETEGRTRAFLKIQDGCNQFCTYCMIPYVRGRVRSRAPEDVLKEADILSRRGYREIVLTGIHISSYGLDFDEPGRNLRTPPAACAETNRHLLELAEKTAALPFVEHLRFGSLEPGIMTKEFVEALAGIPEICEAFHLSLQSGCDATLMRMKRSYTTAEYEAICRRIRAAFPNPALTTDIIAGFPGETEEEFEETVRFLKKIRFAKTHIFKYSKRSGTKAAVMDGQVSEEVKRLRSTVLKEMDLAHHFAYASSFDGKDVEVLFEEKKDADGRSYTGHTREALTAVAESGEDLTGLILRCRVTSVEQDGTLSVVPLPLY